MTDSDDFILIGIYLLGLFVGFLRIACRVASCFIEDSGSAYHGRSRDSDRIRINDRALKELREQERLGMIDEESARSDYQSSLGPRERREQGLSKMDPRHYDKCRREMRKVHKKDVELKRLRQLEAQGIIDEESAVLEYNGR